MTPLRTRFIEDMQLHGYSPKTQSCYVGPVSGLAKPYHKSPDLISEEELRRYFLFLTLEKKVARATATIALCGIKFLFQNTLQRNWTAFKLLRPRREKKLPVVLSREEVRKILPCVRTPMYRVCLTTIYSCGLRLSEGLFLRIADVDSERMLLRIRGKGNKDRFVPLPQRSLEQLRALWLTHHSPSWFAANPRTLRMLWTIPPNNGPGVFLQDNASGPLRSWAEIFPANRRDRLPCLSAKPGLMSARHESPERGGWLKKQNPC